MVVVVADRETSASSTDKDTEAAEAGETTFPVEGAGGGKWREVETGEEGGQRRLRAN